MGGGPSKADKKQVEDLEKQRDAQKAENDAEYNNLRRSHSDQEASMRAEMESKQRAVAALQRQAAEQMQAQEEELRKLRIRQEEEEKQLARERAAEVEKAANRSAEEKKNVELEHAKRAAELKKAQEEELRRAIASNEAEKKRRDEAVKAADEERKALLKENAENVKKHRKELDEMTKDHRKKIDEHYERMEKLFEESTKAAIERIVENTQSQLAIVDENFERVKKDAVNTMYNNFFRDYMAIRSRGESLQRAITEMKTELDSIERHNEVSYEIRGLNSDFTTESVLLNKQLNDLRLRLKTCLDISEDFKHQLLEPMEAYERSYPSVQSVGYKILTAGQRNDVKALESVADTLTAHNQALTETIAGMNDVQYESFVKTALGNMSNLRITEK